MRRVQLVGVWELTRSEADAPPGGTIEFTADGRLIVARTRDGGPFELRGTYQFYGDRIEIALRAGPDVHRQTMTVITLTDTALTTADAKNRREEFRRKPTARAPAPQ